MIGIVAVTAVIAGFALRKAISDGPARADDPLAAEMHAVRSHRAGLRVLFVGNSFTSANSMIDMIKQLAADNPNSPRTVLPYEYAPGGSQLWEVVHNPMLLRLLSSVRWNIVVLQEQSQLPALPYWLVQKTLPAVAQLADLIKQHGATPLLFETWGYQLGDDFNFPEGDSYQSMQTRLHNGYAYLSRQLGIDVVPVGDTWELALSQMPTAPLWGDDGRHPSLEGSYLAAAVLNSAFDRLYPQHSHVLDPKLNTYSAGLSPSVAAWLRQTASTGLQRSAAANAG